MKILIERDDLDKLLKDNSANICNNKGEAIGIVVGAVIFFITALSSGLPTIPRYASMAVAFAYLIYGVIKMSKTYTIEKLESDIVSLNTLASPHSLVAVKDTFRDYPNRFLTYYDARWDCYLFVNYKTVSDNEESIKSHLSNELKVPASGISLTEKATELHKKYSVSHNETRLYEHTLYYASFDETDIMKSDSFEIDGKKYKWMSIAEMKNDSRIQEVNSDIVSWVGSVIP